MALMLALQSLRLNGESAIDWKRVGDYEKGLWMTLRSLPNASRNYKKMRMAMDELEYTDQPVVPFISLFLTDAHLTKEASQALKEARQSATGQCDNIVPWHLLRQQARILKKFARFQCLMEMCRTNSRTRKCYPFQPWRPLYAPLSEL